MTDEAGRLIASMTSVRNARGNDEKHLQDLVEKHLIKLNVPYTREFRFNNKDRPDFFLDSGLVIEVKMKVSPDAIRQIFRYAKDSRTKELLVISWIPCSRPVDKFIVDGAEKPVYYAPLWRTLL